VQWLNHAMFCFLNKISIKLCIFYKNNLGFGVLPSMLYRQGFMCMLLFKGPVCNWMLHMMIVWQREAVLYLSLNVTLGPGNFVASFLPFCNFTPAFPLHNPSKIYPSEGKELNSGVNVKG
jgi:hypothetical protein